MSSTIAEMINTTYRLDFKMHAHPGPQCRAQGEDLVCQLLNITYSVRPCHYKAMAAPEYSKHEIVMLRGNSYLHEN